MSEEFTCRIEKGGKTLFESTKSGVAPLIEILDKDIAVKGATAYDKIVGKAAAFLYSLMEVKEIHAGVMSRSACEVLKKEGIAFTCETLTENIINRKGDGLCPMETAVLDIESKTEAYFAIKEKLAKLNGV